MDATNTKIKKILPVLAVVAVCAACLVTVAYAYNANYSDTVNVKDLTPSEDGKYIYITAADNAQSGLEYPVSDVTVNVAIEYNTTTTSQGITATPTSCTITGVSGTDVSYADGIVTIKIGSIVIHDHNTNAAKAFVSVNNLSETALAEGKNSLLKETLAASNIFMKTATGNYSNIFAFDANKKADVDVYLVAEIDTEPDVSKFNLETRTINSLGELESTLETTLQIPGFDIEFSATDTTEEIEVVGDLSGSAVTEIKAEAAAATEDYTLKVTNASGASIVMDKAAIATLGDDAVSLTVSDAQDPPAGVNKAYEISFGDNHFGNGSVTISIPYTLQANDDPDNMKVAFINGSTVSEIYDATYADGHLTFTTTHLSTYGVIANDETGEALVNNLGVKVTIDGKDTYFDAVYKATNFAKGQTAVINLTKNVEDSGIGIASGTNITLNLNGYTLSSDDWGTMFYADEGATNSSLTINAGVNGKIDAGKYSILWADYVLGTATRDFDLTINGGTYTSEEDWGFILYDAENVVINDAVIETHGPAIWCGNFGPSNITMKNVNVTAGGDIATYLGSVGTATLTDVTSISAAGTALEIKSGNVTISGGTYTGAAYNVSNTTINTSGSGNPLAAVFINNGYCAAAGCEAVKVTIKDNATIGYSANIENSKPVVVMTAAGTVANNISVEWADHSADVYSFYNEVVSTITVNGTAISKA